MTKYAYIEFNRVTSILDIPEGFSIEDLYPYDTIINSFECNDEVEIGWYFNGENFASPESPRYNFIVHPISEPVFPGSVLQLCLNTENVEDNTAISYTISGLEETDLSSGEISGDIIINSGVGEVELTINPNLEMYKDKIFSINLEDVNQSCIKLLCIPFNAIEE